MRFQFVFSFIEQRHLQGILECRYLRSKRRLRDFELVCCTPETAVIGNRHEISASLFAAGNSIASTLANEFTEADSDLYLSSLFYLALILLGMNFLLLAIAKTFLARRSKR